MLSLKETVLFKIPVRFWHFIKIGFQNRFFYVQLYYIMPDLKENSLQEIAWYTFTKAFNISSGNCPIPMVIYNIYNWGKLKYNEII